jgi:hypothetical protein
MDAQFPAGSTSTAFGVFLLLLSKKFYVLIDSGKDLVEQGHSDPVIHEWPSRSVDIPNAEIMHGKPQRLYMAVDRPRPLRPH